MAEINENDIISAGGIQAPLKLRDNLEAAVLSLDKLIITAGKLDKNISGSKSIADLSKQTEELAKSQQDLDKIQKDISVKSLQRNKDESKTLEELVAKRERLRNSIRSLNKDQKEDLRLLKEGTITRKEYNERVLEGQVAIAQYQQRINRLNQEVKNEILLNKSVGNEYKQLTVQLERARATYKNLAASGLATNDALRQQQRVVQDLEKKVRTIDNAVGQFQRNVGNYPGTFGVATTSLVRFLGAFGIVTGIALFAKTIKGVIDLTVDYEAKNSKLRAVLGATASDVRVLRDQQQELGRTTVFTATQVAEMQIELAKLGFPTKAIKEMTASTIDASIAMGSGLAEQAALTGATLRAFGLQAKDATRVNDVLAKATASSGLDFEKLATAMPYVAANARALGISLEGTAALMGELANSGFQASTIGTTLRAIFLKLADSGSALSKRLKEPVRDTPSLLRALKQLSGEGIDLGEAFELTDKRAVSAFLTLVKGSDSVNKLEKTLNAAAGSAREMAAVMQDNLRGDTLLLTSAWQGLILALTEGDSLFSKVLRGIVQLTTAFLNFITPIKSATEELVKEQAEINVLVGAISEENVTREAKKKLVEELNKKYPVFLKNLDGETATTEQLKNRLAEVNEEYRKKILLKSAEASLQKVSDAIIESIDEEAELTIRLNELKEENAKITKSQNALSAQTGNALSATGFNTLRIAKAEQEIVAVQNRRSELQEELNNKMKAYQDALKLVGIAEEEIKNPEIATGGKTEDIKEVTNELLKFRLEQNVKLSESVKERVFNEIALELFLKGELLKNTKLTEDERAAIVERSLARVRELQLKGQKDSVEEQLTQGKALAQKQLDQLADQMQSELSVVLQGAIRRGSLTEEDNKAVLEIKKKYAFQQIELQIETVKRLLEIDKLTKEEQAALEKELAKLRVELQEATFQQLKVASKDTIIFTEGSFKNLYDSLKLLNDNWGESTANTLAAVSSLYQNFAQSITAIFNNISAGRIANIDSELKAFNDQTQREIKAAGDNDAAKAAIEANAERRRSEFERKKIAEQQRAAKFNKTASTIQAAINTAQGITAALTIPPPAGFILAALVGVLGGLQVAAIQSQPLPRYEFGVKPGVHRGGPALVGEKGVETVRHDGKAYLTPARPTIMNLPKGAEVIPNKETMQMLAYSSLGEQVVMQNENIQTQKLIAELREMKEQNKEMIKAIYSSGVDLEQQGTTLINWKRDADGNKKAIRKKSLGY